MADRTPPDPAASACAPVTPPGAALPGGPAVSPVAAGGKTPAGASGNDSPPAGSTPGTADLPGGRAGERTSGTGPGRGGPAPLLPPRPGQGQARTWTITLPAGLELLSLNDRLHWRARHARAQVIKDAACVMARKAGVPLLGRARVAVEYQPPDRRHRDADNPVASAKAAIDGLVMARCLIDDECPRYVTGIYCTIGEIFPRGRLVLHLTEEAP